jgi:hypothetical protein
MPSTFTTRWGWRRARVLRRAGKDDSVADEDHTEEESLIKGVEIAAMSKFTKASLEETAAGQQVFGICKAR